MTISSRRLDVRWLRIGPCWLSRMYYMLRYHLLIWIQCGTDNLDVHRSLALKRFWLAKIIKGEIELGDPRQAAQLCRRADLLARNRHLASSRRRPFFRPPGSSPRMRRCKMQEPWKQQAMPLSWAWPLTEVTMLPEPIGLSAEARRFCVTWVPRRRWEDFPLVQSASSSIRIMDKMMKQVMSSKHIVDMRPNPCATPEHSHAVAFNQSFQLQRCKCRNKRMARNQQHRPWQRKNPGLLDLLVFSCGLDADWELHLLVFSRSGCRLRASTCSCFHGLDWGLDLLVFSRSGCRLRARLARVFTVWMQIEGSTCSCFHGLDADWGLDLLVFSRSGCRLRARLACVFTVWMQIEGSTCSCFHGLDADWGLDLLVFSRSGCRLRARLARVFTVWKRVEGTTSS